jgi:hypothetical protein
MLLMTSRVSDLHHLWYVFFRELYKLNVHFRLLTLLVFVLTTIYAILEVYFLYKPNNQKDSKKYHRSKVAILVPSTVPDLCLENASIIKALGSLNN